MPTRLGLFCDKVIEAGLLAAVAAVPVFFNVYSERSFEPDKAALLRSLILLLAVAWLIQAIENQGGLRQVPGLRSQVPDDSRLAILRLRSGQTCDLRLATCGLSLLTLVLAAVYCLSTLASVAPSLSLWGSYQRAQGLYTLLAYIGVFFLALHVLRSREQVERLVTVVLLTSLPVMAYGWLQQLGLDPQGWGGPQAGRVFSTLGNPIFLGGYLITVIPLTVARILPGVAAWRRGGGKNTSDLVSAGVHSFLLFLQLACLVFSQSRGPLVALLGSVYLMLLLMAAVRGERRLALALLLAAAAFGGLLILSSALPAPLQGLKDLPYLGRYRRLLDPRSSTARQRILTWQGTVDLITSDPVRALIGYGPDTLIVTFNRHFPRELVPLPEQITITYDRAHNAPLDILATTGLLGLGLYLAFIVAILSYGLRALGLLERPTHRRAFIVAFGTGALLGVLVPRLIDGSWRLSGLGLAAGGLLGLIAFLAGRTFTMERRPEAPTGPSTLLIALLTGILAHFIEIQFGIAVAPTTLHFWLFAAAIVSLVGMAETQASGRSSYLSRGGADFPVCPTGRTRRRKETDRRSRPTREEPQRPQGHFMGSDRLWTWMGWDPARVPESLLIGLLLATLGFGLMTDPTLLRSQGIVLMSVLVLISLLCHTLLAEPATASLKTPPARGGRGTPSVSDSSPPSIVGNVSLSLIWGLVYLIPHVLGIVLGDDGTGSLTVYYAYVLLTVVGVASSLLGTAGQTGKSAPQLERDWDWRVIPLYAGLVVVAVWLAIVSNLNAVKADIHYKQALAYGEAGRWDESLGQFEQAVRLAPQQDFYTILLTGAYVQKAYTATTVDEREMWMKEAEASLLRGWQRNPLYPDHSAKLGLLYRIWGEMAADPLVRRQRLSQAEKRYEEAAGLSPKSIPVLNGWAMVHMALGNYDQAETILQRSLSLRPSVMETHLRLGDTHLAQGHVDEAAASYAQAIALDSDAALQIKQGEVQAAPQDAARHLQLALVYREMERDDLALQEAQMARSLAGAELPGLTEVLVSVGGR